MRILTIGRVTLLCAAAILASTIGANAQSCGDLWYERNEIYQRAGYCFKTARAI
jgi:hypothetical protein